MLEQSVTTESVVFPCCAVLPGCGVQHAELNWYGQARKGFGWSFFYLLLTSLLETDLTFAGFLGREINLWVGGNRDLEKEGLGGMKQQWCSLAGLSVRL